MRPFPLAFTICPARECDIYVAPADGVCRSQRLATGRLHLLSVSSSPATSWNCEVSPPFPSLQVRQPGVINFTARRIPSPLDQPIASQANSLARLAKSEAGRTACRGSNSRCNYVMTESMIFIKYDNFLVSAPPLRLLHSRQAMRQSRARPPCLQGTGHFGAALNISPIRPYP
jgi:hypothetical protein